MDQLAEKISSTGLKVSLLFILFQSWLYIKIVNLPCNTIISFKVVRLCAKSREAVSSPVEHLTLHYQVSVTFHHQFSFHTLAISVYFSS